MLKDPRFHGLFLTIVPTYQFIDRANGQFNSSCGFKKDYAALISAGWDIDTAIDEYLAYPDESTYQNLVDMGVLGVNKQQMRDEREAQLRRLARATDEEFKAMRVDPFAMYKS